MSIDRRFLNWGVFFIALGAVPVLVDQGMVSHDAAGHAWKLWPLIVVGIGVGILLRRTPAAVAGGLMVAATFGLVFGGLLAAGPGFEAIGCGSGSPTGSGATSSASGTFAGAASVRVQLDCGTLDLSTAAGSGWQFQGNDPQGAAALIDQGPGSLDIRAPSRSDVAFIGNRWNRTWNVTLPTDPSVDLTVGVNAGSGTVDLANMHLSSLDAEFNAADARLDLSRATAPDVHVNLNAGSAKVTLPASGMITGSLTVNAGSLDVCAAAGTGLRLHVTGALSSTDFSGAGLSRNGDTWTNAEFATASNRADLQVDANVGSVNLNPAGGCQ